jgi:hypothetical protein
MLWVAGSGGLPEVGEHAVEVSLIACQGEEEGECLRLPRYSDVC